MAQTNAKSAVTLEIAALSHGPYGIGRHEGRVVMVPGTVPGDRVSAEIIESKGNYAVGEVREIVAASPHRREPPCPYVGACGGCPWQHIDYAAQLAAKAQNLEDALRRIGKLSDFQVLPILQAPHEFAYRRRIQLRCDDDRQIGFSRSASHALVAIDACAIAAKPLNQALEGIRRCVKDAATRITAVEIVAGDREGQLVLVISAAGSLTLVDNKIFNDLSSRTGVSGVIVGYNGQRHVWGDSSITVVPEPGIELVIEADLFTQVNAEGNRALLQNLLGAGAFDASDRVLELYCGAGNFTLAIARRAGTVLAVEGRRRAINSGMLSARCHDIDNIRWRAEPVAAAVAHLARRKERFSKIVLDPPRAGAKGIEGDLAALHAQMILYISCNPATLARDAAALARHGYKLTSVQPMDLFPQTFHLETLAMLKRQ